MQAVIDDHNRCCHKARPSLGGLRGQLLQFDVQSRAMAMAKINDRAVGMRLNTQRASVGRRLSEGWRRPCPCRSRTQPQ
jgi:hypothetical protein